MASKQAYSPKQVAERLTCMLKEEGIRVMRYDAYSSNSIYLKLDDGVLGTIRISDHPGKKHLKYKYNLMKNGTRHKKVDNGIVRHYFPFSEMELLFERIVKDYWVLINQYGDKRYDEFMKRNREEGAKQKGFWQKARYV